jgi:3',5'-cyclic-AMP phosphodiesterase
MKTLILLLLAVLLFGCDHFEYSPNQVFDRNSPVNLNAVNLERLASAPVDDTVTIAFTGDSQRFYDNLERFVERVNEIPEVDFIFLAGDISDFGLLNEFEWVNRYLSSLSKPYLAVLGNHDVIADGEYVFTRMFGPTDYVFVYDSIRFVVHNTNGREYPTKKVPDMDWLQSQFSDDSNATVKYVIGVSHVPPFDGDFNQELVGPYTELLRTTPGFLVSLHAHIHEHMDGYPFNDGVRYITSYAFDKRSFVLLKISGKSISKTIIDY